MRISRYNSVKGNLTVLYSHTRQKAQYDIPGRRHSTTGSIFSVSVVRVKVSPDIYSTFNIYYKTLSSIYSSLGLADTAASLLIFRRYLPYAGKNIWNQVKVVQAQIYNATNIISGHNFWVKNGTETEQTTEHRSAASKCV